jgi:DNA-binding NarL/FixJ family response regulator
MDDHETEEMVSPDDYRYAAGRVAAKVLVAAATTLYREGVLAALRDDERFLIVGIAQDERELVWRVVVERPDVALLDVELLRAAVARGFLPSLEGGPRLIVLAVADREEDITACAQAGATEIVRRRADREELIAAVDRALQGESRLLSLRSALAGGGASAAASLGALSSSATLTRREREILHLIEAGRTNKAIALELSCSISTVKNHVHSLLAKLGVSRRTEAAHVARDLLPAEDTPAR